MPARSADTAGSRPPRSGSWPKASSRSVRSSRAGRGRPFRRVLVANRGEIACRIIRTLRGLGIESVAVHSQADTGAKHVREADLAVPVGEAPATASYLNAPVIVRAALETGAEAVHPGYGFLSESPSLAAAVLDAGLAWVGPEPKVLELTGDKVAARDAFRASEFPVLPGAGPFSSSDQARVAAAELGYPLIVKAVMGGGGIGMGVAGDHDALETAVQSASSRGARFFSDASVYLERYVEPARHVEVQILADDHRTVHLSERECSVQRRHQKVLEETPSPALDADLRLRMCQAAVASMEAIGYRGAGTVECVVTPDRAFYFLEVNARIQVEHPVTEATTGVDLVAEQLRIAAGAGMSFETPPERIGHAIESRVYAEDPDSFLPSPGRIDTMRLPEGARCDFGYDQGDDVPMFYDPLIGKVVVTADARPAAIEEMRRALGALVLDGPKTNVASHMRVLGDPRFQSGEYDTGLLGA